MFPYKINFVDSDTSPAVQEEIEKHLTKLGETYDRITSAEVMVRIPHKRHNRKFFHIHVRVDLPGKPVAVTKDTEDSDAHMDIHKAINDAFHKVERQIATHFSKRADFA